MRKHNLDEMQEQKLLRIEHNAFWLVFWLLAITVVVQVIIGGYLDHILGEVICLGIVSVYTLISCLKNGIWDRSREPGIKTNLLYSLAAGVIVGVLESIQLSRLNKPYSLSAGLILGLSVFVLSLVTISFCSHIYKKRLEKLEQE